jgi:hypothetical protein
MRYVYLDAETRVSPTLTLNRMTLRQYLEQTEVLSIAFAHNDSAVMALSPDMPEWNMIIDGLRKDCANPDVCIVAHNASFDVRVLVMKLGCPWPQHVHCTMELAQAWSPNQPGGYSLENLAALWTPVRKMQIDLKSCTKAELLAYNAADVEACRELHRIAMAKLPPIELAVHEMTQQVKEVVFDVDASKVASAVAAFATQANATAEEAARMLGSGDGFNFDGANVRSVKPADVKNLLLANLGFDTPTISEKKMNPEKLRRDPVATAAIKAVGAVNKALSHKRRVAAFGGMDKVDCELTYFAAHTGRFSSRNSGKGLNLHNMPKRNPIVAKPVRELFRLPDDLCFVRGDFANVEYRVNCLLSRCQYGINLFTKDVLADPYSAFWTAATGLPCSKKDPARQLAKAAVLGLGYIMGIHRWMEELLRGLADPTFKVTLADLEAICATNGWTTPSDRAAKAAMTKIGAPWAVAAVAYETRRRFHDLHPEFGRTARWLERSVDRIAGATIPVAAIHGAYAEPHTPQFVSLRCDDVLQGRSVRAGCGPGWENLPTVCWRDLMVRQTKMGAGMTFVRAGNRPPARTTVNILLENIVQAAARNALCTGLVELGRMGHPYVLHVHDEVMIISRRDRQSVLQARDDLLRVYGPGGYVAQQGWDWSVVIKPDEVGLSRTLYEDEKWSAAAFAKLDAGDDSPLGELP